MERYESLGTVGEGSYGVVLKCRDNSNGSVVAIKKFLEPEYDKVVKKIATREIKILKSLRHDNLVNLLEVFRKNKRIYLVLEFVEQNLLEVIEKTNAGLGESRTREIIYQVARGIDFMHSNNVIHRDLKPENVLVNDQGLVKLCDFGFARQLGQPNEAYTDYVATRWYRSPELLVGEKYGKPVDIWAIGSLAYEVLTAKPLFPGESDLDQLYLIMNALGDLPESMKICFKNNQFFANVKMPKIKTLSPLKNKLKKFSADLTSFVLDTLAIDPHKRLNSMEVLQHKYFTSNNWNQEFETKLKGLVDTHNAKVIRPSQPPTTTVTPPSNSNNNTVSNTTTTNNNANTTSTSTITNNNNNSNPSNNNLSNLNNATTASTNTVNSNFTLITNYTASTMINGNGIKSELSMNNNSVINHSRLGSSSKPSRLDESVNLANTIAPTTSPAALTKKDSEKSKLAPTSKNQANNLDDLLVSSSLVQTHTDHSSTPQNASSNNFISGKTKLTFLNSNNELKPFSESKNKNTKHILESLHIIKQPLKEAAAKNHASHLPKIDRSVTESPKVENSLEPNSMNIIDHTILNNHSTNFYSKPKNPFSNQLFSQKFNYASLSNANKQRNVPNTIDFNLFNNAVSHDSLVSESNMNYQSSTGFNSKSNALVGGGGLTGSSLSKHNSLYVFDENFKISKKPQHTKNNLGEAYSNKYISSKLEGTKLTNLESNASFRLPHVKSIEMYLKTNKPVIYEAKKQPFAMQVNNKK